MASPKKEAMALLTSVAEGEAPGQKTPKASKVRVQKTSKAWSLAFEHINRYPAASRKDHEECQRNGKPCHHTGDVYVAWWKEAKAQVKGAAS